MMVVLKCGALLSLLTRLLLLSVPIILTFFAICTTSDINAPDASVGLVLKRFISSLNTGSSQTQENIKLTTISYVNSLEDSEVLSFLHQLRSYNFPDVYLKSIKNGLRDAIKLKPDNFYFTFSHTPDVCSWIFDPEGNYDQITCPRAIGLDDGTDVSKVQMQGQISRDRLYIVDLTVIDEIEKSCPIDTNFFRNCTGHYKNIKLLASPDRTDMTPWVMPRSTFYGLNHGNLPELSRPFAPHLIAVRDAFLTSWGYIFDFQRWYIHGGCADRGFQLPTFEYDMDTQEVLRINEPVLNLVHPYPSMFYHEYVELHSQLLMALPILTAYPNITIVVNKGLRLQNLFPLLELFNINPKNYNFLGLKEGPGRNSPKRGDKKHNAKFVYTTNAVIFSPFIITPLSIYCQYLSRTTTNEMRKYYARLPYWQEAEGDGIVVYDRYNLRPKRFLAQGPAIFRELTKRYGHKKTVKMFFGNETLEETIRIFRGAKVLVAAHGGGEANMLFMPPNGIIIEVRPQWWPITCFIDLADNIGAKHHMLIAQPGAGNGRQASYERPTPDRLNEMNVNLDTFLPWIFGIIDKGYNF